jgi:hypothetical protein
VHLRVPARQYDAAYARASRAGLTVPELLRRASWAALRVPDDDRDDGDDD